MRMVKISVASLLTLAALPALAHPGHGATTLGFLSGVSHPFSGLDHLLAMLAVGLWSSSSTRRIWLTPMSFAGMLLVGAWLSLSGLALPAVEPMIAASVLVFGLLILARVPLPEYLSATLSGSFALFHGAAHGLELGASMALVGMVIGTALLHGVGIGTGLLLKTRSPWWQRLIGATVALSGVGFALKLA